MVRGDDGASGICLAASAHQPERRRSLLARNRMWALIGGGLFVMAAPALAAEGGKPDIFEGGIGNAIVTLVVFVADGDTVRVLRKGRLEWVRLLRIDTPERGERGYGEARAALAKLVDGRTVLLEFEVPGRAARDEHHRLLAYLLHGAENVNVEMVRRGWSPFWTRYGEGRYAPLFRRAEEEAREAGAGLWEAP